MKYVILNPKSKMKLEKEINNEFKENGFFYEECPRYMAIEANLSDHTVYRLNKEVFVRPIGGLDEYPDYIMFIEGSYKHFLGLWCQQFEVYTFNEEEIDQVAKLNGVFSADEISYMEAFEHYEDEECDEQSL